MYRPAARREEKKEVGLLREWVQKSSHAARKGEVAAGSGDAKPPPRAVR
jgi:hypothetical protein